MTAAAILSALLSKRFPKKSDMVAVFKCRVMIRVLLPRRFQASKEPIKALPKPIQVDATPNFQPN